MIRLHILAILCLLASVAANGQTDELAWYSGHPCWYNVGPTQNCSNVGCYVDAQCVNGKQLRVGFYQWWSCQDGNEVQAYGGTNLLTAYYNGNVYDNGVTVWAMADVILASQPWYNQESGWDSDWCAGSESFSGSFNYGC